MRVLASEVVGILAHVQRADADGTGRFKFGNEIRVRLRRWIVAVDLAAGAGDQVAEIEQALDAERNAGQRPGLAGPHIGIHPIRSRHGARCHDVGEGAEAAVVGFDPAQGCGDNCASGGLARFDRLSDFGSAGGRFHARKTGAGSASSLRGVFSSRDAIFAAVLRLDLTPARCASATGRRRTSDMVSIHLSRSAGFALIDVAPRAANGETSPLTQFPPTPGPMARPHRLGRRRPGMGIIESSTMRPDGSSREPRNRVPLTKLK